MKNKKIFYLLLTSAIFASVDEYISQIDSYLSNGKFQEADELFIKSLLEYDASAELYYVGAKISIKMDNLDNANKHYVKAIKLDPKNEEYRQSQQELAELKNHLTRARKTFDSGLLDEAIIEFENLTKKYEEHAIVFYNLGRVYRASEEYDLAVNNYQHAQSLNPFEEKYPMAIKAIAQISAKKGDEEFRRQEFDAAIGNYQKATDYYPEYTVAFFKLARTYYKMKDIENARLYLKQGLLVDPKQEQSEKMLGDIYRKTDDVENALDHYHKAIKINANYFQAYYSLGALYLSEGKIEKARDALKSAIRIKPTYSKAYGVLGTAEQELGNIDLAIHNYSKSLEYDTNAYDIHCRLSNAYNISQQYKKAKKAAKESLAIKRNYAPAYFELGVAEKKLGNLIAAKDAFEKAKKDRNWRKSAQYELDLISKGL